VESKLEIFLCERKSIEGIDEFWVPFRVRRLAYEIVDCTYLKTIQENLTKREIQR
jgi:hypothetical protein